jgi:hypothetical protein
MLCGDGYVEVALLTLYPAGRKRSRPRHHPLEARLLTRANHRARRIHPQALRAAVHHLAQPEVLPHAREPQLQHRQEHREAHLQLQPDGGWVDARHGRAAGRRRALLLPGREERYFIIPLLVCGWVGVRLLMLCGRLRVSRCEGNGTDWVLAWCVDVNERRGREGCGQGLRSVSLP